MKKYTKEEKKEKSRLYYTSINEGEKEKNRTVSNSSIGGKGNSQVIRSYGI